MAYPANCGRSVIISHSHGDPSLGCIIPDCRYPGARFLCGRRAKDWHAGMTRGLCVLPQGHRLTSPCMDQHGNTFDRWSWWTDISSPAEMGRFLSSHNVLDYYQMASLEPALARIGEFDGWLAYLRAAWVRDHMRGE